MKNWVPKAINVESFGLKFIASYHLEINSNTVDDVIIYYNDVDFSNHLHDSVIEDINAKIVDYES